MVVVMVMQKVCVHSVEPAHLFAAYRLFGIVTCKQFSVYRKKPFDVVCDNSHIMRDKDNSDIFLFVQASEQLVKPLLRFYIDSGVWLVKDEYFGL